MPIACDTDSQNTPRITLDLNLPDCLRKGLSFSLPIGGARTTYFSQYIHEHATLEILASCALVNIRIVLL